MKITPFTKSKVYLPVVIVFIFCALWVLILNAVLAHTKPGHFTYVKNSSYTVWEPVYVEQQKSVPVVSSIEVNEPAYIEKVIEVPGKAPVALKDWDSPEQLAEFLKNDDTNRYLILQADSSGGISFNGQCEDLALQLRDRAMAAGRFLSVQVLDPAEYYKWYGIKVNSDVYHAICMARIGNEFWYIEPSNDKQWLALYLD
jgi:hypothetical protein